MSSNRREFSRAHVLGLLATLYTDEHGRLDGRVDDVSLGGLHVLLASPPPVGTPFRLYLRLEGRPGGLSLHASGVVARRDEGGVGLRLDSVDEEAFAHLRRLVLLNADDPERAESEMDEHLGLRPRSGTDEAPS